MNELKFQNQGGRIGILHYSAFMEQVDDCKYDDIRDYFLEEVTASTHENIGFWFILDE